MLFRYTRPLLLLIAAAVLVHAVEGWTAGEPQSLAGELIGIGILVLMVLVPLGLAVDVVMTFRHSPRRS